MCCSPWAHRESDTTEPQQTKLQFFIHRLPKASPGHQEPPGPALPPTPSAAHYFHTGWNRSNLHLGHNDRFLLCSSAEITTFSHEDSSILTLEAKKDLGWGPSRTWRTPPGQQRSYGQTRAADAAL